MTYTLETREKARTKSAIAHREPYAVRQSNWQKRNGLPPICMLHREEAIWHRNKARESGGQWVCPTCARHKAKGQKRTWKTGHTDPLRYNLARAVAAAKFHSKKIGRPFSLSVEDVLEIWNRQKGRCAISDIQMEWLPGNVRRNRNKVTMDRIDSSKGYERDNVWLVCDWVNRAKTDMTKEESLLFACGIQRAFKTIVTDT